MTEPSVASAAAGGDQPCRLLYLAPQLSVGGLERQLTYLLEAMDRKRFCPAVVVWNYRQTDRYVARLRDLTVPLIVLPSGPPLGKVRALRKLVRRLRPEVVHSYSFYLNSAATYACLGGPTIAVGSIRCDFDYEVEHSGRIVGPLSARWPRHKIANSWNAVANAGRARWPFTPGRIEVVQNAIDLDAFRPAPPPALGPVTIAGVGALSARKNWAILLPVLADLTGGGLDVRLRIAGEGPLRPALEDEARRRGVEKHFELVGQVDDVSGLLADADIVVHVSGSEGTPNVVLEAMAAGRPVVALDSGDIRRLVDDGVTGFVAPPGRADLIGKRLRELVGDPQRRAAMGDEARRRAERDFGTRSLAERTLEAYTRSGWAGRGH